MLDGNDNFRPAENMRFVAEFMDNGVLKQFVSPLIADSINAINGNGIDLGRATLQYSTPDAIEPLHLAIDYDLQLGDQIFSLGYSGDKLGLHMDACTLRQSDNINMLSFCDISQGASGGPTIHIENGTINVVGVNWGFRTNTLEALHTQNSSMVFRQLEANRYGTPALFETPECIMITASALNVRSGPSTAFDIVAKGERGRVAQIVSDRGNWLELPLNGGETGFVSEAYTQRVPC
jgi:hypothetical protein